MDFARSKKRSAKKIRKAVKKQLQYIRRDLGYVDILINYNDVTLSEKQSRLLDVIRELYAQQQDIRSCTGKTQTHEPGRKEAGIPG